MHGSYDVAHHETVDTAELGPHEVEGDLGKYLHGSEDVAHEHRWYYMLQALEEIEAHRRQEHHDEAAGLDGGDHHL